MLTKEAFDALVAQSEKTISAKILADSVNPDGNRLTTMELTYPRCIHSEFMTHRMFSRNSASSRAIPIEKMIKRVQKNPFFPIVWGKNQKGMQAAEEITQEEKLKAGFFWLNARDYAVGHLQNLLELDIHKQIGNRIVEPWMWITVICSGSQWENFFALRCHHMAEPHIQNLAYKMRDIYDSSNPQKLEWGEWHLPLVQNDECETDRLPNHSIDWTKWSKISAGRCARVSYLTHDGKRDPKADIELCERLTTSVPLHASPLEHPAQAVEKDDPNTPWWVPASNFGKGWKQLRKFYKNENVVDRV